MTISKKLLDLLRKQTPAGETPDLELVTREGMLQTDQREQMEHNIQILDSVSTSDQDIRKEASRQLREAAIWRAILRAKHQRNPVFGRICHAIG